MPKEPSDKIDVRYHDTKEKYLKRINSFYSYFARYHDHDVEGMENIPKEGPCLIAVNHSLVTYDIGILQYKIYKALDVFPRGLADNAFFKVAAIGRIAGWSGAIPGDMKVGEYILREHKAHLIVAPGGMRESLRPKEEKYQIKWDRRKGFVRLALKTQTPIVLAACPAADDLYKVLDHPLTKFVYKRFRMPMPVIRPYGRSLMPKKVRLVHYVSPVQHPPQVDLSDARAVESAVTEWHADLTAKMNALMAKHPVDNAPAGDL